MTDSTGTPRRPVNGLYLAALAAVVVTWCYVKFAPPPQPRQITSHELTEMRPVTARIEGHATDSQCIECHEHKHTTWFDSYHRTMTQEVTPETVIGAFNDQTVDFATIGNAMHLTKEDGMPWVSFENAPDLAPASKAPRKKYPLVMSTGSHHLQFYWYPVGADRTLAIMPLGHLIKENRWIPLSHSFLSPPGHGFETQLGLWNNRCVRCHATYPEMGGSGDKPMHYDTTVTAFGISCEACHGPAENHVALQRNLKNPQPGFNTNLVDHVVNPANLTAKLSTAVCAGCHSIYKAANWQPHVPGKPLGKDRRLVDRDQVMSRIAEYVEANKQYGQQLLASGDQDPAEDEMLNGAFWPDGKPRVTGGDYNSLLKTACFTKGDLSCVSCHQLHQAKNDSRPRKEWANDQLKASALGNQACTQCHEKGEYETTAHTHHAAGSSGSSCYNCHMPYTSYGLLTAIRSHTIYSPDAAAYQATGRPTACNLCHLDKSLGWTADHLQAWYGIEKPELNPRETDVSLAAHLSLSGDAAQRSLVAYAMGWEPALKASTTDWIPPYLGTLLKDPYAAVRHIAGGSLKRHDRFADFDFDWIREEKDQEEGSQAAFTHWAAREIMKTSTNRPAVLLDAEGNLDREMFDRLYSERDNKIITIVE